MKAFQFLVLVAAVGVAALSFLPTPAAATPAATTTSTAAMTECEAAIVTIQGAMDDCDNGDYWACYYIADSGWVGYLFRSCLVPFCGLFV